MNSLNFPHAKDFLLALLKRGKVPASTLRDVIKTYATIKKLIELCEKDGLVKSEEVVKGRRVLYVWLTERGRAVAEKLKEAEEISKSGDRYWELAKRMKAFYHLNTYEDHLTIIEFHMGKKRIVDIFPRRNGKYLYLWCEYDKADYCDHIYYVLHDYELRDAIMRFAEKEGLKLAPKYDRDEDV